VNENISALLMTLKTLRSAYTVYLHCALCTGVRKNNDWMFSVLGCCEA